MGLNRRGLGTIHSSFSSTEPLKVDIFSFSCMQSKSMLRRIGRVVRALDSHPGDREFESRSGLHPRVGASLAWGYTLRPRPVVRLGDLHPL